MPTLSQGPEYLILENGHLYTIAFPSLVKAQTYVTHQQASGLLGSAVIVLVQGYHPR